jgi:four helix bundle protein
MRIYEESLKVVADVCRLANRVQQYDKDLARQMRRACASVPLNMQEGLYSRSGNRIARFHDSMGSARETMACLHVCIAARYVDRSAVLDTLDRIDHVVAGLYRLCHKRTM